VQALGYDDALVRCELSIRALRALLCV